MTSPLQLRLDFSTFTIAGPTTATATVTKRVKNSGIVAPLPNSVTANWVAVTAYGQCLTDTFTVTNPDGSSPPTICGTNTGQHSLAFQKLRNTRPQDILSSYQYVI